MRRALLIPLLTAMLVSCVAPPANAPVPRPAPATVAPSPAPSPAPAQSAAVAVQPGSWTYAELSGRDATWSGFGTSPATATLIFECERPARVVRIRIARISATPAAASITLRATSTARTYPSRGGGAYASIDLAANDPMLDALAFSRGRFGVTVDGGERWFPAWPEVARVVEDCRG